MALGLDEACRQSAHSCAWVLLTLRIASPSSRWTVTFPLKVLHTAIWSASVNWLQSAWKPFVMLLSPSLVFANRSHAFWTLYTDVTFSISVTTCGQVFAGGGGGVAGVGDGAAVVVGAGVVVGAAPQGHHAQSTQRQRRLAECKPLACFSAQCRRTQQCQRTAHAHMRTEPPIESQRCSFR